MIGSGYVSSAGNPMHYWCTALAIPTTYTACQHRYPSNSPKPLKMKYFLLLPSPAFFSLACCCCCWEGSAAGAEPGAWGFL